MDERFRHFSLKKYLTDKTPKAITAIGNLDILSNKTLAVFSSSKCPGSIILKTYDLMKKICRGESQFAGMTVISGFHSPMEQECLNILLRGRQPVILCPARNINGMRIKAEYKKPFEEGRLLVLSPFFEKEKRISSERSLYRNRFVAALADTIFAPHVASNGKTEQLCREVKAWNKDICTFEDRADDIRFI
jgi:predicted Rossmann fold nucleotide-binding protein DprA/Smf involved in DNA uptake